VVDVDVASSEKIKKPNGSLEVVTSSSTA